MEQIQLTRSRNTMHHIPASKHRKEHQLTTKVHHSTLMLNHGAKWPGISHKHYRHRRHGSCPDATEQTTDCKVKSSTSQPPTHPWTVQQAMYISATFNLWNQFTQAQGSLQQSWQGAGIGGRLPSSGTP